MMNTILSILTLAVVVFVLQILAKQFGFKQGKLQHWVTALLIPCAVFLITGIDFHWFVSGVVSGVVVFVIMIVFRSKN